MAEPFTSGQPDRMNLSADWNFLGNLERNGIQVATVNDVNAVLPSQVGQNGKFLTTNGANVSWGIGGAGSIAYSNIPISYAGNTVSGDLVFPHLLGTTPRRVVVEANKSITVKTFATSTGVFDASGQYCIWNFNSSNGANNQAATGGSAIVFISDDATGTVTQIATIAVDAVNCTLSFVKSGNPVATGINLICKFEG